MSASSMLSKMCCVLMSAALFCAVSLHSVVLSPHVFAGDPVDDCRMMVSKQKIKKERQLFTKFCESDALGYITNLADDIGLGNYVYDELISFFYANKTLRTQSTRVLDFIGAELGDVATRATDAETRIAGKTLRELQLQTVKAILKNPTAAFPVSKKNKKAYTSQQQALARYRREAAQLLQTAAVQWRAATYVSQCSTQQQAWFLSLRMVATLSNQLSALGSPTCESLPWGAISATSGIKNSTAEIETQSGDYTDVSLPQIGVGFRTLKLDSPDATTIKGLFAEIFRNSTASTTTPVAVSVMTRTGQPLVQYEWPGIVTKFTYDTAGRLRTKEQYKLGGIWSQADNWFSDTPADSSFAGEWREYAADGRVSTIDYTVDGVPKKRISFNARYDGICNGYDDIYKASLLHDVDLDRLSAGVYSVGVSDPDSTFVKVVNCFYYGVYDNQVVLDYIAEYTNNLTDNTATVRYIYAEYPALQLSGRRTAALLQQTYGITFDATLQLRAGMDYAVDDPFRINPVLFLDADGSVLAK